MAIENELPPSAAPALEAARLTIQAMRKQVEECEAHNTDLTTQLAELRRWCQDELQAARAAVGRGSPRADDWAIRVRVLTEVWDRLKAGL